MIKTSLIFLLMVPALLRAQCNGHSELCSKRYDQVAYLTTHNAFNAGDDGFNLPNQTHGLTRQLQDGVRALMLDVYDVGGVATEYHGYSFLGTATLASDLTEIKDFLSSNPNEVVTIIFETYITSNMMDTVITQVGLKPMLYVQTLGQPWPTLQEMIDADKRLVIFSDHNNGQSGQDWYHYLWDFAVETDFENHAPSDLSCDFNRGDAGNDLFIVNHFLSDATLGTGVAAQAQIINQLAYFYDRVHGCQIEQQKFPNFPTVDFYEMGQTLAVIDSLNDIHASVGIEDVPALSFSVSPNPGNGIFHIRSGSAQEMTDYSVSDISGKRILTGTFGAPSTIDLTAQPGGIYFLSISDGIQNIKLINLPN